MTLYVVLLISVFLLTTSCAQRAGDALNEMPSISSTNGLIDTTLTIEYANYTGAAHSMTNARLLNGTLPGPTIRLKAGDKMRILFQNMLTALAVQTGAENEYRFPDHSNLHFHGAHVSGELPSDDVRIKIAPGGAFQYETDFPENHMPGTHWIHPHVHGSSALQVGAGASMPLIVEDPPNYLSQQVADAKEVLLFVQHMSLDFLQHIIDDIGDKQMLIEDGMDPDIRPRERDYRMINGQYQPTLTLRPGEWQRWRVVYGGWLGSPLDFEIIGDSCEMQLLAKDGVYIHDFPRKIDFAPIPTGGRADIMVRCATEGSFLVVDFGAKVILNIDVTAESVNSTELEPWSPPDVPQYVQDLRGASPANASCSCSTRLHGCGGGKFCINGNTFDPQVFVHTVRMGEIVDRTLENVDRHPYHQHVYPFQIVDNIMDNTSTTPGQRAYFKEGDWHDVVIIPGLRDNMVVRYQPTVHLGRVMIHCHILAHEDLGMMSQENVVDADGQCQCNSRTRGSPEPDPVEGPIDNVPPPAVPPPAPPTGGLCFSGNNLVELAGNIQIPMNELRVGDMVKVSEDMFEPVYMFGHHDIDMVATYLRIISGDRKPLEITRDHLVFSADKEGRSRSIPASKLVVGDLLLSEDDTFVPIRSIEEIVRTGVYAPFTLSGEIVVSGIKTSNYITLQTGEETLAVGGLLTPLTYQWLSHAFQAPHRLLYALFGLKTSASDGINGISPFVTYQHVAAKWMLEQSPIVLTLLMIPLLVLLVAFWVLEKLLSCSGYVFTVVLMVCCFTTRRDCNCCKKC